VANKDELDQLLIDRIAATIALPEADPARWRDQVRELMHALLAAYRAHPGSARAALATIPTMEGGLRVAEWLVALLIGGGIHPQAAAWFTDLGSLYVSAIAAEESIWRDRGRSPHSPETEDEVVEQIHGLFSALPPAIYPTLSSYADVMTAGDGPERFEFGIDVLLAGLEAVSARMSA
jgi:hypothetical protein